MANAAAQPALYRRDGDVYVPQSPARGPWDPDAQVGGAPAALLTTLVDTAPSINPMQLARFTLDLLRPVPMQPLGASVRIVRDGKRSQVLEASLTSDGVEVARASALRILLSPNTEPWCTESDAHPVWAPVEWQPETLAHSALPGGLDESADLRFTGPGQYPCWARLKVAVVAGEEVRPLARLGFVADFASYIAQPPRDGLAGINADISFNVIRSPLSEWLSVDGRGWLSHAGMSQLQGLITDIRGPVATVSMARLIFPRG